MSPAFNRFPIILGSALLAAACASTEETLRHHGYSEDYVAGYQDGCSSGRHAAGSLLDATRQDAAVYGSNEDYRTGWDYGFHACSLEFAAIESAVSAATHTGSVGYSGVDAKKALKGIDTSGLEALGQ